MQTAPCSPFFFADCVSNARDDSCCCWCASCCSTPAGEYSTIVASVHHEESENAQQLDAACCEGITAPSDSFLSALACPLVLQVLGGSFGFLDGPIAIAKFHTISSICEDSEGNLIIADQGNNAIRLYDV